MHVREAAPTRVKRQSTAWVGVTTGDETAGFAAALKRNCATASLDFVVSRSAIQFPLAARECVQLARPSRSSRGLPKVGNPPPPPPLTSSSLPAIQGSPSCAHARRVRSDPSGAAAAGSDWTGSGAERGAPQPTTHIPADQGPQSQGALPAPLGACSGDRGSWQAGQRCTVPRSLSCGTPLLYGVRPGPPALGPGIPMLFPPWVGGCIGELGIAPPGGIALPV
jgi:hypothetical protein